MLRDGERRLLPDTLVVSTRPGRHLSRRLRRRGEPVPSVARHSRAAAGARVSPARDVLELAESVPRALLGHVRDGARLDGGRARHLRAQRTLGELRHAREHGRLGADVAALSVVRQRGADLVQLRLGVAAARDRLPGDLSRREERRAAGHRHLAAALGPVPSDVRRRSHQAAGRCVLAGSHVPRSITTRASRCPTRSAGTSIGCPPESTSSACSSITSPSWSFRSATSSLCAGSCMSRARSRSRSRGRSSCRAISPGSTT